MKNVVFVSEDRSGKYLVGEPYRYAGPGIKNPAPWGIQFRPEFVKVWPTMVGGVLTIQTKKIGAYRPKSEKELEFLREHKEFKAGLIKETTEENLKEVKKRYSSEALLALARPVVDLPQAPSEPELAEPVAVKVPKRGK